MRAAPRSPSQWIGIGVAAGVVVRVASHSVVRVASHSPSPTGRRLRRLRRRAAGQSRRALGRARRRWYAVSRGCPDPWARDEVLAQRVRASLGLVTAGLDLPRVRTSVADHVVTLTGWVGTPDELVVVLDAVWAVSGVADVVSELLVGLPPGINRPSDGAAGSSSHAMHRLREALLEAGCPEQEVSSALRQVLVDLLDVLSPADSRRLRSHLPPDVCALTSVRSVVPVPRRGADVDLREATRVVLRVLRGVVPDDVQRFWEELPADLRDAVPENQETT